ncbi:MAG: hypothetical protein JNK38_00135, partial [Acidobacteria bacterium]|nr:hypothetical protein [Acidobacteriota bacterium]
ERNLSGELSIPWQKPGSIKVRTEIVFSGHWNELPSAGGLVFSSAKFAVCVWIGLGIGCALAWWVSGVVAASEVEKNCFSMRCHSVAGLNGEIVSQLSEMAPSALEPARKRDGSS